MRYYKTSWVTFRQIPDGDSLFWRTTYITHWELWHPQDFCGTQEARISLWRFKRERYDILCQFCSKKPTSPYGKQKTVFLYISVSKNLVKTQESFRCKKILSSITQTLKKIFKISKKIVKLIQDVLTEIFIYIDVAIKISYNWIQGNQIHWGRETAVQLTVLTVR